MKDRLRKTQPKWNDLFHYNSHNLSFYFIFKAYQKLFNVSDIFTEEEVQKIEGVKRFFQLYQSEYTMLPDNNSIHEDNLLGINNENSNYSIIQWMTGQMETEFKEIVSKNSISIKEAILLIESINWALSITTLYFRS